MNLDYYAIGLSVGVVFAVLPCAILRLVQKRKEGNCQKEEYDERQIIARGVAYRNGMFAMFIYNAISARQSIPSLPFGGTPILPSIRT